MMARTLAGLALGALGVVLIGALAGSFNPDHFVLTAVVFGACTLAPVGALCWVLLARKAVPEDRNAGDNVESRWAEQASAKAFLDVLVVVGLGLAVVSIARITLNTQLVLLMVLVVAWADVALRYVTLQRRDR